MAENKAPDGVQRTSAPKDAPDGTPLHVDTFAGQKPGPDVSNAPDQNPLDLKPAPGPSSVEILGTPGG
jgi:hypothetical protein